MKPRLTLLILAYESSAALLGDRISYLAYGSNLHPAVFERRRGIKPLAMSPAVAPGWRLAFDLRGGGAEPSFASARPDARRELYGALYDLTPSDWARVCASHAVQKSPFVAPTVAKPSHRLIYAQVRGRPVRLRRMPCPLSETGRRRRDRVGVHARRRAGTDAHRSRGRRADAEREVSRLPSRRRAIVWPARLLVQLSR